MADEIPVYFEKVQDWIVINGDMFPSLAEQIGGMEINWQEMFNTVSYTHLYCTMGETLMQRRRVKDDVFRYVNFYQQGR